jgi:molybdate transport system ATP-binding protein
MAVTFGIQLVIVDHHDQLPKVINKKLTLDRLKPTVQENFLSDYISKDLEHLHRKSDAQEGAPVIEIKNLKIQYGEKVVLTNFSWTVRKGERWALVGRNGAGKTTLFSMIFADHPLAYTQEIYLFGKRRGTGESIWDIKKRISYLGPEQTSYLSSFDMSMSARRYLQIVNKGGGEESLEELISIFSAGDWLDKKMRILSSGQRHLVMIIACFLRETEMLLLDEPFQFLDTVQRLNLSGLLRSALYREKTLILITHDQNDLAEWTAHTMQI